jgi:proteasome accessory factor C
MSTTAKDQVARLLALVPMIGREGALHVEEAAAALGVSPAQVVQDLRVLIFCGWPGYLPHQLIDVDLDAFDEGGDGRIRISNAEYLDAPLRLSRAEASAVVVALRTLREGADEATRPSVDSALKKLEEAVEEGSVASVDVPEHERAASRVRGDLTAALESGRQVRLAYYVPARDERTERVVDPLGLVTHQGVSYLDAWCHRVDARRSFRLDRVESAEVLETAAAAHDDVEPLDLSEGIFRPGSDMPMATLRLTREARWVAEYYPVEAARALPEGALEVDLRVADERWLLRLLLRLAPYAEVVRPREFSESLHAAAAAALSLYR